MNNKLSRLILVGLVCVIGVTGCGNVVTTNADTVNISFSWWGNDDRHNYTMDGVDIFQSRYPNINIEYRYGEWSGYERKNRVWIESHTESDVMQINYAWLDTYSADGLGYYDLYELTDYIDLSSYDEDDLEYGMVNGHLNAIPIAFNKSTVCFNKELYEQYGLDYPRDWDDLFEAAEVFSKDGIYTLCMAKKHLLLMLIAYYEQTTGLHVFDEDGTLLIDEAGVGYMLDFYKELIDKQVLMPIEQFDRAKFGNGEAASSIFWISDADNYCGVVEAGGYTPVIGDYFMDENATLSGVYMKPATMYAISSITENPEEAAMLLDFLVNDKTMALLQGTEKGVPVSHAAVQVLVDNGMLETYGYIAYENMQAHKDELNVMIPMMESEAIIDAFKEDADAYIYDIQDRETTMKQIYEDIQNVVNGK